MKQEREQKQRMRRALSASAAASDSWTRLIESATGDGAHVRAQSVLGRRLSRSPRDALAERALGEASGT